MKRITSLGLGAFLVLMPHQSPAPGALPCLMIGTCIIGAGMVIYISTCGPKYYCVWDPEVERQWCRTATFRQVELEGNVITSGPYKKAEACSSVCDTNKPVMAQGQSGNPGTVTIEKSTNLQQWTVVTNFPMTVNAEDLVFDWSETNSLNGACFYRAFYTTNVAEQ